MVEHSRHPGKLFGVAFLTQILGHHLEAKLSLTVPSQARPIMASVAIHHPGARPRPPSYAPFMPQLRISVAQGFTVPRLPGLRGVGLRGLAGMGLTIPRAAMGRDPRLAAVACSSGEEAARGLPCVWMRQVVRRCATRPVIRLL
jgi:hypothetical protein